MGHFFVLRAAAQSLPPPYLTVNAAGRKCVVAKQPFGLWLSVNSVRAIYVSDFEARNIDSGYFPTFQLKCIIFATLQDLPHNYCRSFPRGMY